MQILHRLVVGSLAAAVVSILPAQVQVPQGFIADDLITSGLNGPMDIDFTPDGRMLIAQRAGSVLVWTGSGAPAPIGAQGGVTLLNERGLLSIAVDPGFATNGYIYLWYSRTGDQMSVTRWTLVGDLANPGSTNLTMTDERRLLDAPDQVEVHNGGAARFGPDGKLYVSMGDDLGACSAQRPTALQGKIVRLDVATVAPGGGLTPPAPATLAPLDNPVGGSVVFAIGLRNPFRMEIDPITGALYVADVGATLFEEVSELPGGGGQPQRNLGWPWREGTAVGRVCSGPVPTGLVAPIAVEPNGAWRSIVAGPRYRNLGGTAALGAAYEGDLFYVDYFSGTMRRYQESGGNWSLAPPEPGQPAPGYWATGLSAIAALRQGPDGGLYVVQNSRPGGTTGGFIRRIRALGPVPSGSNLLIQNNGGAFATSGGFGDFATALPDFDGDGWDDIATAAPSADDPLNSGGPQVGAVYVHSGRRGTLIRKFLGTQVGANFGRGIDSPGDTNGDGVPELLVSAYDHDAGGLADNGRVTLFDGATAMVLWDSDGEQAGNSLGYQVAAIPDITGDGLADVVAGAPGYAVTLAGQGRVVFLDGATGARFAAAPGTVASAELGGSLAAAKDTYSVYAGDDDAAVWSVGMPSGGTASLTPFRGALPGNHEAPQLALVRNSETGYALAIGTPTADTNGLTDNGTVEFYGTAGLAWTHEGTAMADSVGLAVIAARDVDGDGEEEVLYVAGSRGAGRAVIARQDGSIDETTPLACQGTVRPLSIEDVTGDGRGEWGYSWFTDLCGRSETLVLARGLEQVVDTPQGGYLASFEIDLGVANAGRKYWQLYSVSGTSPGLLGPVPWPVVPLNLDDTTEVMDQLAGSTFTPDSKGVLDATGRATTNLFVPAPIVQFFVQTQTEVVTIAAAFGPPLSVEAVSNPIRLSIR